jgi:hypothetical protein
MDEATISFRMPPTFGHRVALRVIGFGVLLLTDRPLRNLWAYRGRFWNLGCWTLQLTGKVSHE